MFIYYFGIMQVSRGGGSKISHSMGSLETCLYSYTMALQVNWSGAITEVPGPGQLSAFLGLLANVKVTVRQQGRSQVSRRMGP